MRAVGWPDSTAWRNWYWLAPVPRFPCSYYAADVRIPDRQWQMAGPWYRVRKGERSESRHSAAAVKDAARLSLPPAECVPTEPLPSLPAIDGFYEPLRVLAPATRIIVTGGLKGTYEGYTRGIRGV